MPIAGLPRRSQAARMASLRQLSTATTLSIPSSVCHTKALAGIRHNTNTSLTIYYNSHTRRSYHTIGYARLVVTTSPSSPFTPSGWLPVTSALASLFRRHYATSSLSYAYHFTPVLRHQSLRHAHQLSHYCHHTPSSSQVGRHYMSRTESLSYASCSIRWLPQALRNYHHYVIGCRLMAGCWRHSCYGQRTPVATLPVGHCCQLSLVRRWLRSH